MGGIIQRLKQTLCSAHWDPLRDFPNRLELYRWLLVFPSVFAFAGTCLLISFLIPIADPIDVVGLSLIQGTASERNEQFAYYLFFICSFVSAPVFALVWRHLPGGCVKWTGILFFWGLLLYPLSITGRTVVPLAALLVAASQAGILQSIAFPANLLIWMFVCGLWWTVSGAVLYFSEAVQLGSAALVLAVAGIHFLQERNSSGQSVVRWKWTWFVTALWMAGLSLFLPHIRIGVVACSTAIFLAASDHDLREAIRRWLTARYWLTAVVVLISCALLRPKGVTGVASLQSILVGAATGFCLKQSSALDGLLLPAIQRMRSFRWSGPLFFYFLFWLQLNVVSGWFWLMLVVIIVALKRPWHGSRSSIITGWRLAGLVFLMGLVPVTWVMQCDPFHHGQLLSAVWQFENGEKLYSQVFPLRAMEFFLTWLTRLFYSTRFAALDAYVCLSGPLQMAGGALAAFAWTRSPWWSLSTAIALSPTLGTYYCGIREGFFLLLVGIGMELFRRRSRTAWLVMIPLGVLCCFCGFDLMTSFIPPIAGTLFLAPGRWWGGRRVKTLLWGPLLAVGFTAVTFSIFFLWIWSGEGADSVVAFCEMFRDMSRNYAAFYGVPFYPLRRQFPQFAICLAGFGGFTTWGALNWFRMSLPRRRMWTFLILAVFMWGHRCLGRSDLAHISTMLPPLILLWSLLLFESLRRLFRRDRHHFSAATEKQLNGLSTAGWAWTLGCMAITFVPLQGGLPFIPPWKLAQQLMTVPVEEPEELKAIPEIQELVTPEQYLWPIEDGIANYANRRRNPTRHAIAYCIGSLKEQLRSVADIAEKPTTLVAWEWGDADYISGLIRYYAITPHILRNYRPLESERIPGQKRYLVPVNADWSWDRSDPNEFKETLGIGLLPVSWGEKRWPRLQRQVRDRFEISSWQMPADAPALWSTWTAELDVDPRRFNYLLLEFPATPSSDGSKTGPRATLRFSLDDRHQENHFQFDVRAKEEELRYLIPIGCHPGWTWQPEARHLSLQLEGCVAARPVRGALLEIEERAND